MKIDVETVVRMFRTIPWLTRYPLNRIKNMLGAGTQKKKHLIFTIANHFEPAWNGMETYGLDMQKRRLDGWCKLARNIGESVRDADGTKFRHTNFYPAEQYDRDLLAQMADLQREGLGEVEVHLHHGVDSPDSEENLRRQLTEFRDRLSDEHKCLSRIDETSDPMYAFVHGNWSLGNSAGGYACGVDNELQVLQETGCYADMTLPSAPDRSQVPMLNAIYECNLPLEQRAAHRKGLRLRAYGGKPKLPIIVTGPLMLDWTRNSKGLPLPKLETGELACHCPTDMQRIHRWTRANVTVSGRSDWVFIKLFCHGFFPQDQPACIGDGAKEYFTKIVENGDRTGEYSVHFASAREMFNMIMAAVAGETGKPGDYRNYALKQIMDQ